jgi:hypothetical protein
LNEIDFGPYVTFGVGLKFEFSNDLKCEILENINWDRVLASVQESESGFFKSNRFYSSTTQLGKKLEDFPRLTDGYVVYRGFHEDVETIRKEVKALMNLRNKLPNLLEQIELDVNLYIYDIDVSGGDDPEKDNYNIRSEKLLNVLLQMVFEKAQGWFAETNFFVEYKFDKLDINNYRKFYNDLQVYFQGGNEDGYQEDLRELRFVLGLISALLKYRDLYKKYEKIPLTLLNPQYENKAEIIGVDTDFFKS